MRSRLSQKNEGASDAAEQARRLADHLSACATVDEAKSLLKAQGDHQGRAVCQELKNRVAHALHADVAVASRLAELCRLVARHSKDPICRALALHAQAMVAYRCGHNEQALRLFHRAEKLYTQQGEWLEAARVGRAKIVALMYLNRYRDALALADRLSALFEAHGHPHLLAELKSNVGLIYHHLDEYHKARHFFEQAEALLRPAGDSRALAHVVMNLAMVWSCLGDYHQSARLFARAGEMFHTLGLPVMVVQTEYNLAYLEFLRGKFDEAIQLFTKVKAAARGVGDESLEVLCDLDLAELYLQVNAFEDVLESAEAARRGFARLRMRSEQAKAQVLSGVARLHLGELDRAARALRLAQQTFRRQGNRVWTALCDLYMAELLARKKKWRAARTRAEEAFRLFRRSRLETKAAFAECVIARMTLACGETARAKRHVLDALGRIERLEAPWVKYQGHSLLGEILEGAGDARGAAHQYDRAIAVIESLRSRIRADEMKASFLSDKLRAYERMVALCLAEGSREKISRAFAYVEAAKSRALADLLGAALGIDAEAPASLDPELAQRWKQLREDLDWYYSTLNHLEQKEGPAHRDLAVHIRGEIRARESELNKLLRTVQWKRGVESTAPPIRDALLEEVAHELSDDEALVEYYIADGEIMAFVLDGRGEMTATRLSDHARTHALLRHLRFHLDKYVFNGDFIGGRSRSLMQCTEQYLKALYQELIAPVRPLFNERRKLIIIPHGFLHYIPFHALTDGERYLIDDYDVSYCPSATVFRLCRERSSSRRREATPTARRPLLVGVPDRSAPAIEQEVRALAALLAEAQVLLGEEATSSAVTASMKEASLIHLACHAVFRYDNPIFSSLRLQNSWLTFLDIWNLEVKASLLTLSACQTGVNKICPGDELIGLMRGFLCAGVPSLVVSLWAVNDASTTMLMREFYARLRKGWSKRQALREAQLMTRHVYEHPYYWAPFILMGSPE